MIFLSYGFFIITVRNDATLVFISLAISSLSSVSSLLSVEDVFVFAMVSMIEGNILALKTGLLMIERIYLNELLQIISMMFKLKQ